MSDLIQDLRFGARTLMRSPLFAAATVLTLALGIGLNTAVFSTVHALLFRPLPEVTEPNRLVQLYRTWPGDFQYGSNSIPHYLDVRARAKLFRDVAVWTFVPANLSFQGRTERVFGQLVSENYFDVLGAEAARGRTFSPAEGVGPGAHPVTVLSHSFWRDRFASDPAIIGQSVRVNGRDYTVIGVAPSGFKGAMPAVEPTVWLPLVMQEQITGTDRWDARGSNFLNMIGRLAPGMNMAQAQPAMDALVTGLLEDYPDDYEGTGILAVAQADAGLHPSLRDAQVAMSAVVMTVVSLLLLIACVNVANLLLARAGARRKEMAVRLSIGAGRSRIVRQLLTENLLLSLLAGGAGLGLASVAMIVLNRVRPPIDIPITFDIALDVPVLLFALGLSVMTALLIGLVPSLAASRPETVSALKGDATAGPRARARLNQILVVAQIGMSVLLLIGAGLFLRNVREAALIDVGFDADNMLLASVDPGIQGYDQARAEQFYDRLLADLRALPGVRSAAIAEMVPLGFGNQQSGAQVPGRVAPEDERTSFDYNLVGPGYFETLGIPVRGRGFDDRDDESATGVIVINERMADRFWPGAEALGQRIQTRGWEREVVGVVPTGKYGSLGEDPVDYMYIPVAQDFNPAMTLHVRSSGDPAALAPLVRDAIRALDADLPIYDVRTMNEHLGIALMPARLAGFALALFGLLGLALAAVGIYGVIAFSVARRTREIGIRVALGARTASVLGMVLRQGGKLTAAGLAFGVLTALGGARLVRGMLYAESAIDPAVFIGVPAVLALVSLLATYLPARRAAGIDPIRALKTE